MTVAESTQSLTDRYNYLFSRNKDDIARLTDKHAKVKTLIKDARENRGKCQEVYDESDRKDHRLEPALALFDLYIKDLVNESDVLANRLRDMNSDQCYYADKLTILEG